MPVFASFVALSGRILRSNGYRPEWLVDVLSNIPYGQSFSDSVQADAVPAPVYSISSGSLPPGLSLNSSTGAVTGTATTEGNYTWKVRASNPIGFIEKSFSQTVGTAPSWSDTSISSSMTSGTAFSDSVSATAVPSPTYSVSSGSLPPGLSLNSSTGAISGTPSSAGNYSFTVSASNGLGTVTQSYSRTVVLPLPASVAYLVVAGGGGGRMGGGGAGGMRNGTYSVVSGQNISVTVGAGGVWNAANGGNSTGFGITNTGGGMGGDVQAVDRSGRSGGSGGGARGYYNGSPGISGQGNAGANRVGNSANGGGGGKGSAGGNGGGNGATWIDGNGYAGGGRGSGTNGNAYGASTSAGGAGAANTGAGGGGNAAADAGGGTGGSGIVAFRQSTSERLPTISAGLTYTTNVSGSYRYYYLKGGTGTVNWS